jgi:hypothetical protein
MRARGGPSPAPGPTPGSSPIPAGVVGDPPDSAEGALPPGGSRPPRSPGPPASHSRPPSTRRRASPSTVARTVRRSRGPVGSRRAPGPTPSGSRPRPGPRPPPGGGTPPPGPRCAPGPPGHGTPPPPGPPQAAQGEGGPVPVAELPGRGVHLHPEGPASLRSGPGSPGPGWPWPPAAPSTPGAPARTRRRSRNGGRARPAGPGPFLHEVLEPAPSPRLPEMGHPGPDPVPGGRAMDEEGPAVGKSAHARPLRREIVDGHLHHLAVHLLGGRLRPLGSHRGLPVPDPWRNADTQGGEGPAFPPGPPPSGRASGVRRCSSSRRAATRAAVRRGLARVLPLGELRVLLQVADGEVPGPELGLRHDPAVEGGAAFHPLQDELVQGPGHATDRLLPGGGVDDELPQEGIVVEPHLVPGAIPRPTGPPGLRGSPGGGSARWRGGSPRRGSRR